MLKNLCKLATSVAKGVSFIRSPPFFNRSLFSFSNFTSGNIQKVIVDISMKDTEGLLKHLEQLDNQSKQLGLMMVIDSIERNQLPPSFLGNEHYEKIAEKYPAIVINSRLILNKHLTSELAPLYGNFEQNEDAIADLITKINNNFVICSSQYKRIEDKNEFENYKFLVNRKYSDFYISHLSRYYNDQDKLKTFNNCIDTYRKHNQKFIQPLIKEGFLQLQKNPDQAIKIQTQLLNLIELFAQNVLHLNMIAKQIFQIVKDEQAYKKECLQLKWEIGEVLSSYSDIRDIDYISLEYIEIRRVRAAINYFLMCYNNKVKDLGEKADLDALKEIKKDLQQVVDNFMNNIKQKTENSNDLKKTEELCMAILAMKGYLLRRHSTPLDEQKRQLYKLVDRILNSVSNREVQDHLSERLKDCVDMIPHFEAFPNE